MYDHPAWVQVKETGAGEEITWDQCMLAEDPEKVVRKSTVWLATPPILTAIKAYFSGIRCEHAVHTSSWGGWTQTGGG